MESTDTDLAINDPMIRILRVLGILFAKSAALGFNIFGRLHHTFILHFLQTIHRYLDERNEEERLTGKNPGDFLIMLVLLNPFQLLVPALSSQAWRPLRTLRSSP